MDEEEEVELDWYEEPDEYDPPIYLIDKAQDAYEARMYNEKTRNACQYKQSNQS